MPSESALRALYAANVLVAGWVGAISLLAPGVASSVVFSGSAPSSPAMTVTGALWLSIAWLSICGLWQPLTFSPVLLLQLFYKGGWLLAVALPWLWQGRPGPFPTALAVFFLVWVLVLPLVIPWAHLFRSPAG